MTNFASQKQLYSLSWEGASQLWKSWEKITILNYFPNKLWKSETESDQGCKYVKTIEILGLTKDKIPNRPLLARYFQSTSVFWAQDISNMKLTSTSMLFQPPMKRYSPYNMETTLYDPNHVILTNTSLTKRISY